MEMRFGTWTVMAGSMETIDHLEDLGVDGMTVS
jgi:hypothetical protein